MLTRIPVDRTPYPMPRGTTFFFTPQAHASMPEYPDGTPHPGNVRFILPNVDGLAPGVRVDLWTYDAQQYWRVYGQGTVTADGRQIVPDPGVALRPVTCANMLGGAGNAPASWPKGGIERGDPVNVASGLFVLEKTDLAVADVLPIALTRVYRPNDVKLRGFGPGGSHAYQMFLIGDGGYQWATYEAPDRRDVQWPPCSISRESCAGSSAGSRPRAPSTRLWADSRSRSTRRRGRRRTSTSSLP